MSNDIKIGATVIVNDPLSDDVWNHSFMGSVIDIVEKTDQTVYIIEDQDSDCFAMARNKFAIKN